MKKWMMIVAVEGLSVFSCRPGVYDKAFKSDLNAKASAGINFEGLS